MIVVLDVADVATGDADVERGVSIRAGHGDLRG